MKFTFSFLDQRGLAWGGVDWIRLAQDRDRWRAVVSAVMNLRVLAPRSLLVGIKRIKTVLFASHDLHEMIVVGWGGCQ
jgi:hypothetical protein